MVESENQVRQKLDFLVYIVESPSPIDLYHKRSEGEILSKALSLSNISSTHRLAVSFEAFYASLTVGIEEHLKQSNAKLPFIHISAHGNKDGIQLTNGDIVTWRKMGEILIPINKALNGLLFVGMSSCEGFNACQMAMVEGDIPFYVAVGNLYTPTWSDTAIGFTTLYHLLAKGFHINEALHRMRSASGDDNFASTHGEETQKDFLMELNKIKRQQMLDSLQRYMPQIEENQLVKDLRKING